MKLNCDLGESFGAWSMGNDAAAMPYIHQANIACGFHAGDPDVLFQTLLLAKQHQVEIGAHPSYPDLQGFGRRSLAMSELSLRNALHYQISAISGMAAIQGLSLSYVKPHGALYNDMMKSDSIRQTVMLAVADYPAELALMIQATEQHEQHTKEAKQFSLPLMFEAFADRAYLGNGQLVPRSEKGAVLNKVQMLKQVEHIVNNGGVKSVNGKTLKFPIHSICVHGDNLEAVAHIALIRDLLNA